jgi:hypothetical protein
VVEEAPVVEVVVEEVVGASGSWSWAKSRVWSLSLSTRTR